MMSMILGDEQFIVMYILRNDSMVAFATGQMHQNLPLRRLTGRWNRHGDKYASASNTFSAHRTYGQIRHDDAALLVHDELRLHLLTLRLDQTPNNLHMMKFLCRRIQMLDKERFQVVDGDCVG
jgi:hypothetical protein